MMKSKTSALCKAASIAVLVVTIILCIIADEFMVQLKTAAAGLLLSLIFGAQAMIIDKIEKTKTEQKRIYDSIDALSEKINIMLGLDKTSVAIENLKAETAPIYADAKKPLITSEEDLTWNCPDCDNVELAVNTVCTKCGYDKNAD
ncbi:MAG: hypothetical protein IKV73_03410 [Clostridia bacterium]|nr:hypothetical protein [Clostridia bacterium]